VLLLYFLAAAAAAAAAAATTAAVAALTRKVFSFVDFVVEGCCRLCLNYPV